LSQISKIIQNVVNFGDYDFKDFILNEYGLTSSLKKNIEKQRNEGDNMIWSPDLNLDYYSVKDMNSDLEDEKNEYFQEQLKLKEKLQNIPYQFEEIDNIKVERTNKPERSPKLIEINDINVLKFQENIFISYGFQRVCEENYETLDLINSIKKKEKKLRILISESVKNETMDDLKKFKQKLEKLLKKHKNLVLSLVKNRQDLHYVYDLEKKNCCFVKFWMNSSPNHKGPYDEIQSQTLDIGLTCNVPEIDQYSFIRITFNQNENIMKFMEQNSHVVNSDDDFLNNSSNFPQYYSPPYHSSFGMDMNKVDEMNKIPEEIEKEEKLYEKQENLCMAYRKSIIRIKEEKHLKIRRLKLDNLGTLMNDIPTLDHSTLFFFEFLGKGGCSVVQKAYDKTRNEFVAIKKLLPKYSRKNFENEAALLQKVEKLRANNPNYNQYFLKYYGIFKDPNDEKALILKMESGCTTLGNLLESGKVFSCAEVLYMLRHLVEGLAILKEIGIAHRDIKPSNIVVCGDQLGFKLIDFGAGCQLENNLIPAYSLKGWTETYAAPEVCNILTKKNISQNNEKYNPYLADVYSLGLVIIKMIKSSWNKNHLMHGLLKQKDKFRDYEQILDLLKGMLEEEPKKRWDFTKVLKFYDLRHILHYLKSFEEMNSVKAELIGIDCKYLKSDLEENFKKHWKLILKQPILHEKRVFHWDLKPENLIFYKDAKNFKLIDFETSDIQIWDDFAQSYELVENSTVSKKISRKIKDKNVFLSTIGQRVKFDGQTSKIYDDFIPRTADLVSSKVDSETRFATPVVIPYKGKSYFLADCPGFSDTRGAEMDTANMSSFMKCLAECEGIKAKITEWLNKAINEKETSKMIFYERVLDELNKNIELLVLEPLADDKDLLLEKLISTKFMRNPDEIFKQHISVDSSLYYQVVLNYAKKIKNDTELDILFFNFLKIFKEILEILKILSENNLVHCDIKLQNLLFLLDENGLFQIKCADFGGLISYEEYLLGKTLFEGTNMHKDVKKKAILSKEEFYRMDIYSTGFSLKPFLLEFAQYIPKNQKRWEEVQKIIDEMYNMENLKDVLDLREVEEKFDLFLKGEKIDIDNITIMISPDLRQELIVKKIANCQLNDQMVNKYINIGYYARPIYFLLRIGDLDPFFRLGCIHSLMKNEKLALKYYIKYEKKLAEEKECPEKREKMVFLASHKATMNWSLNEKKLAYEDLEYTKANLKIEESNLRSYYIQNAIINLLFFLIHNYDFNESQILVDKLNKRIEEEKIEPNFKKNFDQEDKDNLNEFFSRIYFLNSLLIQRSDTSPKSPSEALEIMRKSYDLSKTIFAKNTISFAKTINNFGIAHSVDQQHERALEYYKESYKIRKSLFKSSTATIPMNRSFVLIPYYNMAWTKIALKQYDEAYKMAIYIYEERRKFYEKQNDSPELIFTKNLLAKASRFVGNLEDAERYEKEVKDFCTKNPLKEIIIGIDFENKVYLTK